MVAHYTSIQSRVHHPMSRFNLLYTFIVYTLLLPRSTSCKINQTCGIIDIPYPFGLRGSGCGLSRFQIDCVEDVRPVIEIGSHNYTVLDFSRDSQTSRIVDDEYFQNCTSSYDIFDEIEDKSVFDSVDTYNITLTVLSCDTLCLLNGVRSPQLSCTLEKPTVLGGLALWNYTNNPLYQNCHRCELSGGWCGYDISDNGQFLCFCGNATHPNKCPQGKSSNRGTITGSIGKVENFLQSYIHQMPTRYSFSQLKKITNKFADKLGEGGFGVVYKGKLPSGFLVAVKLLDQSRHSERQFINEVATLGTIHHVHLVRLMGYCFEGFRSALVYEYMANGSLEKFIFQQKEQEQMLNWGQLYSIALGAARGIQYLHQDCTSRIIHFDIKPHNILLDADFTPKVADFGLAKLYGKGDDHVSITATRGTPGYVAPELWSRNLGPVTDKSDVYSFGMLLLEIAGRRRNIELQVSHSSQLYFPEWAFKLIESGELEKRLKERGRSEMEVEDEEKVRRMAKVGLWCIQNNSNDRPSMSRVVQMLEGKDDDVSNPPLPFNSSPPREASLSSSTEESSSIV